MTSRPMIRTDPEWTKLVGAWQVYPSSWPKDAGPPPGAIDCLVPQHLLPPHLRRKGPPQPNGHDAQAIKPPVTVRSPPVAPSTPDAPDDLIAKQPQPSPGPNPPQPEQPPVDDDGIRAVAD
jgi:hypothetical protein